jgi:sulfate transport system ATP-binding protein
VVLMNQGAIEQVGTPQQVWDQPASPFVYGFLGDVNLFHGHAHEGLLHLDGLALDAPEHRQAQNAQATAYVRPHELQVERYRSGASGMVAQLQRAIVVGPMARLEIDRPGAEPGLQVPIEAHMSADHWVELGLKEGDKLLVLPRKARVFLQASAQGVERRFGDALRVDPEKLAQL